MFPSTVSRRNLIDKENSPSIFCGSFNRCCCRCVVREWKSVVFMCEKGARNSDSALAHHTQTQDSAQQLVLHVFQTWFCPLFLAISTKSAVQTDAWVGWDEGAITGGSFWAAHTHLFCRFRWRFGWTTARHEQQHQQTCFLWMDLEHWKWIWNFVV